MPGATSFADLANNAEDEQQPDVETQLDKDMAGKLSIDKIFLDVQRTTAGKIMFDYLRERFVETEIIKPGDTASEAWERQGKANLVRMMERAVEDAIHSSK